MDRIEEVDVKHNLLQMSTYLDVPLLPVGDVKEEEKNR